MKVLVIDIGGSNIKLLVTGQLERIKIPSGSHFTP
ncbi:MAG: ROK family protein, partial [Bacteroidetes bacterium]|nr:ROK family protein [Bacteroidota bacterium]